MLWWMESKCCKIQPVLLVVPNLHCSKKEEKANGRTANHIIETFKFVNVNDY